MVRALLLPKHRRSLAAVLTLLLGVLGSLTLAGALSAQSGQSTNCDDQDYMVTTGSSQFGDFTGRLMANTTSPGYVTSHTYALQPPVPAGTYTTFGVSYDGYAGRENAVQTNEVWFAELVGPSGVLATTGTTTDVPDGVAEAFWSGPLGDVTLAEDATQLVVRHGFLTNASPNSVEPVCLGLSLLSAPPEPPSSETSTTSSTIVSTSIQNTTTTTVGETTTTTEAPPDSSLPPGTDAPTTLAPGPPPPQATTPPTQPPPTVSPAGTDAPETQVLGAVEEAGVATAVAAQPTFTG